MHWVDILELLEKLQQSHHLPALLVGLTAGALLALVAARLIRRRGSVGLVNELRGQLASVRLNWEAAVAETIGLKNQLADGSRERILLETNVRHLEGQLAHNVQVVEGLNKKCDQQAEKVLSLDGKLKIERKGRRDATNLATKYSEQLDEVMNSDGKIWLKSSRKVPAFIPLHKRRAAIISLANLKGGVGKTTLTANLGAALAAQGLRVLLIDLDHQSSLTNYCVEIEEKNEIARAGRYIDSLFDQGGDLAKLDACVTRLRTTAGNGQLYLAPVREEFADLENRLMTQWHSGLMTEDVRFRLRQALHSPRLRDHYDVVLIDCPPRLTTGSINAIAASDYILIPVLLEETSAEGVPRILAWLKRFQATSCGEFDVLGVVGNKAYPRHRLIAREQVVWDALQHKSREAWNSSVHHFDEVIRDHPTVDGRFAALDPRHQPRYDELVSQIRRVIPHAHLEPARVPAADVASLDGIGG